MERDEAKAFADNLETVERLDVDHGADALRALGYEARNNGYGYRMWDQGSRRWVAMPRILVDAQDALVMARRRGLVVRWLERDAEAVAPYWIGLGYIDNAAAGRVARGRHHEFAAAITIAMIRERWR